MNGITYYKTSSPYPGDLTKNCSLNGNEIDSNFLNLEGRDVKSFSKEGNYLKLKLLNGNVFSARIGGSEPFTGDLLMEINYNELLSYVQNDNLIPGMQYRIIDYIPTTTQSQTIVDVIHQFDIIVTATSENTFNETAKAMKHADDNYFSNNNLEAWELKYSIYNDTTRFAWGNTNNGKGIVYYMKDEYGNEAPYDFKNIKFARYEIREITQGDLINETYQLVNETFTVNGLPNDYGSDLYYSYTKNRYAITPVSDIFVSPTDNMVYYYTFSTIDNKGAISDASISNENVVSENIIKPCFNLNNQIVLNNIVFLNKQAETFGCNNNKFEWNCNNLTFGGLTVNNTFGSNVTKCLFGYGTKDNKIGNNCDNSIFTNKPGNIIKDNIILNNFTNNIIGNICYSNHFGNDCVNNIFNNTLNFNTFGNSNSENMFKGIVTSSNFGHLIESNVFNGTVFYTSFENGINGNNFENVYKSHINNYVQSNTFESDITNTEIKNNVEDIAFTSGITIENVIILSGIYTQIADTNNPINYNVENKFISINSNTQLKVWNPADLA